MFPLLLCSYPLLSIQVQAPKLYASPALKQLSAKPHEQSGFPYAGLTAIAGTSITVQGGTVAEANLGAVNTELTHSADFAFTLRNTSTSAVMIDRIQPSCQCTTAAITVGGKPAVAGQDLPPLLPGTEAIIHVHINLTGQALGNLAKFVAVYVKDAPAPAAMLQIRATLVSRPPSIVTTPVAGTTPRATMQVMRASHVHLLALNHAARDFGSVNLLDQPHLTQTFTIINRSSVPLILTRLQPSCHCTSAVVEQAGAPNAAGTLPTLAPGQKANICVTVTPEPFQTGPLDKTVQVYAQGSDTPAATLEMTATLLPSLTLKPSVLDFGQVTAGRASAVVLTAEIDSRLVSAGQTPNLVSSNPSVRIVALAPTAGPTAPVHPVRYLAYKVTLGPDAPLGSVQGVLRFESIPDNAALEDLSAAPEVMMTGQVSGAASASPSSLVFGMVPAGQPAVQQLILIATSRGDLHSAQVISKSSLLTARLEPAGRDTVHPASPESQVLKITLSADAPPGAFQSAIEIELANGQRLLIPVRAEVNAAVH